MEKEARKTAYDTVLRLAADQGYVTFDDIMECADRFALSIQDFDWLSNSISTFGIIVYADVPTKKRILADDEYDDFAQSDYDKVYNRITELCPSLHHFVETVRNTIPPQRHEIRQLRYQIIEGNSFARERMIGMHLRIALRIALQRAEVYSMDIEDAIGYACIGLVMAVDKYDPDTSGAFASYATLWILQNISREQSTQRPLVYYPVHKKEGYFTMYPVLKRYGCTDCDELQTCQTAKEKVMSRLSCDEKDAIDIISQMIPDLRYESLISDSIDAANQILDDVEDDILTKLSHEIITTEDETFSELHNKQRRIVVEETLEKLTPKEANILRERYGFNGNEKTLEEVGNIYGVTRERIRQIEAKALKKLRHRSKSKILREYYD